MAPTTATNSSAATVKAGFCRFLLRFEDISVTGRLMPAGGVAASTGGPASAEASGRTGATGATAVGSMAARV
jgi:hypothetical protein